MCHFTGFSIGEVLESFYMFLGGLVGSVQAEDRNDKARTSYSSQPTVLLMPSLLHQAQNSSSLLRVSGN